MSSVITGFTFCKMVHKEYLFSRSQQINRFYPNKLLISTQISLYMICKLFWFCSTFSRCTVCQTEFIEKMKINVCLCNDWCCSKGKNNKQFSALCECSNLHLWLFAILCLLKLCMTLKSSHMDKTLVSLGHVSNLIGQETPSTWSYMQDFPTDFSCFLQCCSFLVPYHGTMVQSLLGNNFL